MMEFLGPCHVMMVRMNIFFFPERKESTFTQNVSQIKSPEETVLVSDW